MLLDNQIHSRTCLNSPSFAPCVNNDLSGAINLGGYFSRFIISFLFRARVDRCCSDPGEGFYSIPNTSWLGKTYQLPGKTGINMSAREGKGSMFSHSPSICLSSRIRDFRQSARTIVLSRRVTRLLYSNPTNVFNWSNSLPISVISPRLEEEIKNIRDCTFSWELV